MLILKKKNHRKNAEFANTLPMNKDAEGAEKYEKKYAELRGTIRKR